MNPISTNYLNKRLAKREKATKKTVHRRILFFVEDGRTGLKLVAQKASWPTVHCIAGSIGEQLGLEPFILAVSCTKAFKADVWARYFGKSVAEVGNSGKATLTDFGRDSFRQVQSGLRLNFSSRTPLEVWERLWADVKAALDADCNGKLKGSSNGSLEDSQLLPIVPSWAVDKQEGMTVNANFLVAPKGTPTFWEVFKGNANVKDVFYRAGKDIWKEASSPATRLEVIPVELPEGDRDGIIFVTGDVPSRKLVRGIATLATGERILLKARMETVVEHTHWTSCGLAGDLAGKLIVPTHNLKYSSAIAGVPLHMDVIEVVDEDHAADTESVEMRKLSGIVDQMAHFKNDEIKARIALLRKESAAKHAADISKFNEGKKISGIVQQMDDEGDVMALSQAIKAQLGICPSKELDKLTKSKWAKVRSLKIKGGWYAIATAALSPAGVITCNPLTAAEIESRYLVNGKVGIMRYPIANYQSMMTLALAKDPSVPEGLLIVSLHDAKFMSADSDDHVLISKPFSSFEGKEEPLCRTEDLLKSYKALGAEKLTFELGDGRIARACYAPVASQSAVGMIFNGMCLAMGVGESALALRLGEFLDIAAQGVKKPYWFFDDLRTTMYQIDHIENMVKAEKLEVPAIAMINLKRNLKAAVRKEYGVTLPKVTNATFIGELGITTPKANPAAVDSALNRVREILRIEESNARIRALKEWESKLLSWLTAGVEKDEATLTSRAQSYAAIFLHVANAGRVMVDGEITFHPAAEDVLFHCQGDIMLAALMTTELPVEVAKRLGCFIEPQLGETEDDHT